MTGRRFTHSSFVHARVLWQFLRHPRHARAGSVVIDHQRRLRSSGPCPNGTDPTNVAQRRHGSPQPVTVAHPPPEQWLSRSAICSMGLKPLEEKLGGEAIEPALMLSNKLHRL